MTATPRTPTRCLTLHVTIEFDLAEHKVPLMLSDLPEMLDDLREEDGERRMLAIHAVVHDGMDPIAEYEYIHDAGQDREVREVRVADAEHLAALGYGAAP